MYDSEESYLIFAQNGVYPERCGYNHLEAPE